MPGLLKIGRTTREVASRVAELSAATGVPTPFKIEACFMSTKLADDEAAIHHELRAYRSASNREFFRCSVDIAVDCIKRLLASAPITASSLPRVATDNSDSFFDSLELEDLDKHI
jgi:hypothetical protein